ncbi:MAG: ABC transporter [Elusimicrobia bacterium RIFOXYB2_FULL_49_7]|nr:MAG: ABC transporter [Elusimicrobia bacterium RIFOXYB2_FULL_49_7]
MKRFNAIFKKEFFGYFNSPIAYVYLFVYIGLTNWLFFKTFFLGGQASMRSYFGILPILFLFFVPAVTMRLWAEERKSGTIEMLFTLPVKIIEVVMGKFLAAFAFLSVSLFLSLSVPISVAIAGDPEWGPILGGYLGVFLMGGAYLAIGMFVSNLTENQIIAFILGVVITFGFYILGSPIVTFSLPNFIVPAVSYLGLGNHYESIGRGVIDSRDIAYYLSMMGVFLFLNIYSIENRKWR